MRIQGEGGRLQAKDRGLRGNQPCRHLHLRLVASRTGRMNFCGLSPQSVVLCDGSPRKLPQTSIQVTLKTREASAAVVQVRGDGGPECVPESTQKGEV